MGIFWGVGGECLKAEIVLIRFSKSLILMMGYLIAYVECMMLFLGLMQIFIECRFDNAFPFRKGRNNTGNITEDEKKDLDLFN